MNSKLVQRFADVFSIIPLNDKKIPILKEWQKKISQPLNQDEINYWYKMPQTTMWGLVCGYEDIEVIDVDLKVFSTTSEKEQFWNEYTEMLRDTIYDFDKKVAIYKTKNGGFHILYKSKRVQGNSKIASLKGHKEAVIETRGTGGQVVIYPENKQDSLSYFEIQYITDADREAIWNISKSYNYEEPKAEKVTPKTKKEYQDGEVTPWEEFNQSTDIWDVVSDDFSIPPRGGKKRFTQILRHGSSSAHSGYIYHDSNCMYLFSTGTDYPHETLITPYHAYTIKMHNGDFSASAKDLYQQGFGDRVKIKELEAKIEIEPQPKLEAEAFPLDIYPPLIQNYIKECTEKLQMNMDYMGCTMLWLISVITGNSYEVEVKSGWKEKAVLWLSLVGKAGIGKSPSIGKIDFPLMKINKREQKKYIEDKNKFDEFHQMPKKERKEVYGDSYEMEEPRKGQFIVQDITLEALIDLHQDSENSVGVHKDELAGWLKDMNKYRAGSDLEFWLSSWSGKGISVNRMTRAGNFVDKPFISVIGGIQPSIFDSLTTEENKENGFMDRLLLAYPEAKVEHYVDDEVSPQAIQWYDEIINKFYREVKKQQVYQEGEIVPLTVKFSKGAKKEWIRIFNKITDKQNDDEENQYLKSMYPKQKSYIPRFALLLHVFDSFFKDETWEDVMLISKESMLKAEKLSNYFVTNAKRIKIESTEVREMKSAIKDKKTNFDKIKELHQANPEFNKSKVADMLGVSRQMIHKYLKQIEK